MLAWLVKVRLADPLVPWVATSAGSFTYWTTAKILVWIAPAVSLITTSGRSLPGILNLTNWRGWLAWGGSLGLILAGFNLLGKWVQGAPHVPTSLSYALLNVMVIAPVFEELLIRGAIFGNLQRQYSMAAANLISSAMFLGLHMPGWYFMGVLARNVTSTVAGSVFLVGLACGYGVHRSRSVIAGILAHCLNNIA